MKSFFKLMILMILAVPEIFGDGFIIIPDPPMPHPRPGWRDPFPLEVKYHEVKVTIDGLIARTKIDQVFYNPLNQRLEGQYIFPIPEGAIITGFKMYVNGKEYKAELLDAEQAKKLYQDIVAKSKDPALLEYTGRNIYTLKIFPIEPGSERKIEIEYLQNLDYDNGVVRYLYPLNTEKFSSKPLDKVSITTDIISKNRILSIYSPTHETKPVRVDDNHFTASYEEKGVKPDKDYLLVINTTQKGSVADLMVWKGDDGKEFFLLTFSPDEKEFVSEYVPKDVVFVLDVSGSMAGEKLEAAQQALVYCISRLKDNDNFQVIKFGTQAEKVFSSLKKADANAKKDAEAKVKKFEAIGGTNIEEALKLALSEKVTEGRPYYVVFITDGKPTIGERDEAKLANKLDSNLINGKRIFTFGVGYDINIHLLDKIAMKTGGIRNYSPPNSEVEVNISSFFSKIESPVLTDVTISGSAGLALKLTYPNEKLDIYKGSLVTFTGLYEGSGSIMISATRSGKKFSFDVPFSSSSGGDNQFIPVIWAMRRVGHLLDLLRLNGESKELKDEIITLSKKYGLITPYTAFLILEDEQISGNQRPPLSPNLKDAGGFEDVEPSVFKGDFENLQTKEGKGGTTASEQVRDYAGADQLNYRDVQKQNTGSGNDKTAGQPGIQDAGGRAFYKNSGYWVDSYIEFQKNNGVKRVEFGSDEYFKLAFKEKSIAQIFSLGRNVRFVYSGEIIEVIN